MIETVKASDLVRDPAVYPREHTSPQNVLDIRRALNLGRILVPPIVDKNSIRRGEVGSGLARRGEARQGYLINKMARRGMVWQGSARYGSARQGKVRRKIYSVEDRSGR